MNRIKRTPNPKIRARRNRHNPATRHVTDVTISATADWPYAVTVTRSDGTRGHYSIRRTSASTWTALAILESLRRAGALAVTNDWDVYPVIAYSRK